MHRAPQAHCPPPSPGQENDRPRGPGPIWEYPYGWPAREACCPHKVQPRGEYFAGPWQSSARLSACALTTSTSTQQPSSN
eukprot:scaffold3416_cov133-Isochrysis_galbana.AAC.4